jgi:acetolactate synthase I/II/III large subunit
MGFALPAAIGAKFACPDKEVWVIAGDGGFQMTAAELATIVQEKHQDQHRHHQQRLSGHGAPVAGVLLRAQLRATPMVSPDFVKLADAHGIPGLTVARAPRWPAPSKKRAPRPARSCSTSRSRRKTRCTR